MSRRKLIIVGAVVAVLIATSVTLFTLGHVAPREGPLGGTAGNRVGMRRSPADVTASFDLMENRTETTFVLESVEPMGYDPEEAEILGIGATDHCASEDEVDCAFGFVYRGWPPPKIDPDPIRGYRVEPGANTVILVGMRFIPREFPEDLEEGECAHDSMRIRGVTVTYRDGIRRYRMLAGPTAVFRRGRCG